MSDDPLIGKQLGPYTILEPIGQGGMATVYKATQPSMARTVAIKILSPQMASNATFLARFKQEAQMIASLEHAHILPVYDLGEHDGIVYIAMRYMGHGSLQSRIAAGMVALRDVSRWLEQIASALDYAHERGVIHRDVKPSNVLIDQQGNAFLADFGIAKWLEGSIGLTGSSVIGTPQYMSPEQGQGIKVDGRSDEYSLGVMAYEMIVGRPPFEAETPLAVVLKHVTEPVTPPSTINPRIAESISNVIERSLAKTAELRYLSCGAFAEALSDAIRSAPPPSTEPLRSTSTPTEAVHITKTQPRSIGLTRPIVISMILIAMLVAGVGGSILLSAVQPTPDRPVVVSTIGSNIQLLTPTPSNANVTPQATISAVTNNANVCAPIYLENFGAPGNLPSGEQEGATWGVIDGRYQLLIKSANFFQSQLIGPSLTDYQVDVDTQFYSDATGTYGLIVAARGQEDYIAFAVDADRNFMITRRTSNGSTPIQDSEFAPALKSGQAINHLRVIQRGKQIALYANDVLLKVLDDDGDPKANKQIGLIASSFNRGSVDARFDNVKVCSAPDTFAAHDISLIDSFDDNRNGWAPQQYTSNAISTIANGKFVIDAIYPGKIYGVSTWNPNVAFNNVDLNVDAQILTGTATSQLGILFGVQDINNTYLFRLINDGRYQLYHIVEGSYQQIADTQASAAIQADFALNHIHISILTGTLTIEVNAQPVMQAQVAYDQGFVGLWCGVDAPDRTRCTFDNLSVQGTPSTNAMTLYPFCNCVREARVGQPLSVSWTWGAKTQKLLDTLQAKSILTVTLDGLPIVQPKQYWGQSKLDQAAVSLHWLYNLPALDPGSHVLEFYVHVDEPVTDGFDRNGDGKPDSYGPGDFISGYVNVVVLP
jgi:serine/threonine protein kinase